MVAVTVVWMGCLVFLSLFSSSRSRLNRDTFVSFRSLLWSMLPKKATVSSSMVSSVNSPLLSRVYNRMRDLAVGGDELGMLWLAVLCWLCGVRLGYVR